MGHSGVVEDLDLFGRVALEADGAAIGTGRGFAIDGFADAEGAAIVTVEEPRVACARLVAVRLARPERAQHRVVKALGSLDVVAADHDVVEHEMSPLLRRSAAIDCEWTGSMLEGLPAVAFPEATGSEKEAAMDLSHHARARSPLQSRPFAPQSAT